MAELVYKDESFKIIGACFEVYNQKGFGFTEPVYQNFELALLVNFGQFPKLAYERLAKSRRNDPLRAGREEMRSWFEEAN